MAKFVAESDPPLVPVRSTVALFAPAELSVIVAGLGAGAVPSIAMKMAASKRPKVSGESNKVELNVPVLDVLM
ncbi:MAG: hypothetical protein EBZ22_06885 [Flavobacteriia bacterium]|nr:hypothetical protein [Flavobacteriia bacterium]